MTIMTDPAIEAAARAVAEAEPVAERTCTAVAAAEERLAEIDARAATLQADREQIARRRAAGDPYPDDGARVALIDMDIASLQAMRTDVEGALGTTRTAHSAANAVLAEARRSLETAQDLTGAMMLGQHADRLAALLLQTAEHQAEIVGRLPPDGAAAVALRAAARLTALDTIMVTTLKAAKAAAAGVPYARRPTWRMSNELTTALRASEFGDGRL